MGIHRRPCKIVCHDTSFIMQQVGHSHFWEGALLTREVSALPSAMEVLHFCTSAAEHNNLLTQSPCKRSNAESHLARVPWPEVADITRVVGDGQACSTTSLLLRSIARVSSATACSLLVQKIHGWASIRI